VLGNIHRYDLNLDEIFVHQFVGLEFWLDVLSFKSLENPDSLQLKAAAFNIQQKYLTSTSLKRIFPGQAIARLEIDIVR
jgi:hypothetical protein